MGGVEHGEWQACLWGTQNALARLSRHVGGGKKRENKLNWMERVVDSIFLFNFLYKYTPCSMLKSSTTTDLVAHAACVLLFSVQGEMDLTWRTNRGEGRVEWMEWDFCAATLTALSSCLPAPPAWIAFIMLKENILFCPCLLP
jgi:hypothetical protein